MKSEGAEIRLSENLNAHIWARSIQKPPRRVKVRLIKDDGFVRAYLSDEKVEEPKKKEAGKARAGKRRARRRRSRRPSRRRRKPGKRLLRRRPRPTLQNPEPKTQNPKPPRPRPGRRRKPDEGRILRESLDRDVHPHQRFHHHAAN